MPDKDGVKIELTGQRKLVSQLKRLKPAMMQAAGRSLYRSAEGVMTLSKKDYVPVDTGALRSTGQVQLPNMRFSGVSVTLGFGGPAAPYAIEVHETQKNYRVGQWKYLETPLKGRSGMIARRLRNDLNKVQKTL